MKQSITLLSSLIFMTFVASNLSAESPVDSIYAARKQGLAEAYYQAGQKFIELGDKTRGEEFINQAKKIWPAFNPQATKVQDQPKAAPEAEKTVAVVQPLPDNEELRNKTIQSHKVVQLQVSKILRGYLTSDSAEILSVLGDEIKITGKNGQTVLLKEEEIAAKINSFFVDYPPQASGPDELYDFSTITYLDQKDGSVLVTANAKQDAPGSLSNALSFWADKQSFLFAPKDGSFKLLEITALN